GSDTGQYKRPRPGRPVLDDGLVTEITMKLIKNDPLTRGRGRDALGMQIRVLSCPAYFDQVIVILQPPTKGDSVARACVEYDTRVCPRDMGFDWNAHVGAITDKWGDIKTRWLWFELLLCTKNSLERSH